MILDVEKFVPFSIYLVNSFAAPLMFSLLLLKYSKISKNLDAKHGLMISYLKMMQLSVLDLNTEFLHIDVSNMETLLAHVVELILYLGFHDGTISLFLSICALGSMSILNEKLSQKRLLN